MYPVSFQLRRRSVGILLRLAGVGTHLHSRDRPGPNPA